MDQYDAMSWRYEVLYAAYDKRELERHFIEEHAALFPAGKALQVHDAACGNGLHVAALTAAGHRVSGSDLSGEMIALAAAYLQERRLTARLFRAAWSELAGMSLARYDRLLCVGNSISHAADRGERRTALGIFRELLAPGGVLLLDSRNWELLRKRGAHEEALPAREYRGTCYTPVYRWEPFDYERPARVTLHFHTAGCERWEGELQGQRREEAPPVYWRSLHFTPFRYAALVEDCRAAGLRVVGENFDPEADRYWIYLKQ